MQQLQAPQLQRSSMLPSQSQEAAAGWEGKLRLRFCDRHGNTEIAQQYTQAPLRIQRPFYPERLGSEGLETRSNGGSNGACHAVVVHTAGGMVGGDRLDYDIHLEPNTQAVLTTAAASKIYRSAGLESSQTLKVRVQAHARLEWLPQDTIVFNQARYRQQMHVELEPGGQWLGWEVTRLGRTAMGERFEAGDWRSRTEIWQAGKPLWIDRQWLPGSPEVWASPHGLANCPIVGSLVFVGTAVEPALIQQLRDLWEGEAEQCGVTRLTQGLICRYRGHSSHAVHQWFIAVWQQLRQLHTGKSPPIPRVWQLS